ncbi:AAA family ATPase [Agromyces humi]|uniref:AAA family ATPase n=1 Tax=Agromyces humi TaxID=1766800 RepID=UPI001356E3B1|nr:AAA family ATPase [Agromyces humi]
MTDARKVDEVEKALAELPDLPEEVAEEVLPVEPEAVEADPARLKRLYDQTRRHFDYYKRESDKLSAREESLRERESATKEHETELAGREAELASAEKEIAAQRLSAKAGFVDDLRAATKEVSGKLDAMLVDAATWGAEGKAKALAAASAEQERLDVERAQLATEWESLRRLQAEVRALQTQVGSEAEFVKAMEGMLDARIQRRVEAAVVSLREDLEDATGQLEAARERIGAKEAEVQRLRNQLAQFGDDPEGLKRRVEDLSQKLRERKDELSRRPPEAEIADLRAKASRVAEAEGEVAYWRALHDQIDSQLRRYLVNVGELEIVRDERDALTAQRQTLRQAIAQQKNDWEELQTKESSARPFPACSTYDEEPSLTREVPGREVDDLADLVDEIRNRMATNSSTSFFYSEADVRIFLAGLAASRLHLLQGISGTGKTSLPREFFKALAGDTAVQIVEVQAGWRDKDDLFGYYNAFEKRFAESEFTKALYRALLPANSDRPMVIVLDEMNLAHPEQYFSVMLSLLENLETGQARLDLLTSEIPNLPRKFEGSRLPLARNVWFVGTANHDETTVAFADKTYDRSHVQVLPPNYERFRPTIVGRAEPISFHALDHSFKRAARDHTNEVAGVKEFLASSMREEFAKFGVGWGNRLERQIERFVPVVLAGEGDLTEAVDHLISTKLVRKLEDRFGVRPEDLESLADNIEIHWDQLERAGHPSKTLEGLHAEARKLRGGFGS